ncbi:hypothetical protein CRM73_00415 [Kocuria sp. CCUG 69068]|uniref:hypothetical protein n=1 Tax=Kocuria sp. CCUG 69068 TaxID=2043138 RepID=UPI001E53CE7A|nr:hypothetical protein [Kocuria sp. CCUG 69068]
MSEPATENQLAELAQLRREIQALDQERGPKATRRHELIVSLSRTGVPVARLATASGVHRSRIYQLLHRADESRESDE